jgi:hypothetical protein
MMFAASDFGRYGKVSKGQKNGPRRAIPVRGPTRLWRTLTWLFLAGLLPSRARLRFTRHYNCKARGGFRRIPRENSQEDTSRSGAVASALLPRRRGPRGRKTSSRWSIDSALLPGVPLIRAVCVGETVASEYSVSGSDGPGRLP